MTLYYVSTALFVVLLFGSWALQLFGLPGNWVIVALTAGFAALHPGAAGPGITWTTVAVVGGLAAIGEILELVAGAAGVARGGSRRGALLAMVGSFAGSLVGAGAGLPIPVFGPVVGVVLGAAVGAMAGAVAGELWLGRSGEHTVRVGTAAFWGRLLGTLAKIILGSTMVAIAVVAALR